MKKAIIILSLLATVISSCGKKISLRFYLEKEEGYGNIFTIFEIVNDNGEVTDRYIVGKDYKPANRQVCSHGEQTEMPYYPRNVGWKHIGGTGRKAFFVMNG